MFVHIEISANSENNRFNITVLIESVNRKLTVAECGSSRHWRFNNGWITAQYRQMDDPAVFLIVMLFGSEGIFFFFKSRNGDRCHFARYVYIFSRWQCSGERKRSFKSSLLTGL